jgi:transcription elongation factor Elf1
MSKKKKKTLAQCMPCPTFMKMTINERLLCIKTMSKQISRYNDVETSMKKNNHAEGLSANIEVN